LDSPSRRFGWQLVATGEFRDLVADIEDDVERGRREPDQRLHAPAVGKL
jgi:hypothetical protein